MMQIVSTSRRPVTREFEDFLKTVNSVMNEDCPHAEFGI